MRQRAPIQKGEQPAHRMQVRHPHAFSPQRTVCRILFRANNLLVGRFVHQFKDSVSVRRSSCDRRAAAALRVRGSCTDLLSHSLRAFSRVFSCVLISSVCGDLTAVVRYESVWAAPSSSSAARTSLRIAHSLLQAQRSNRRQPRGDPFSASLRALMGEGVAFY